MSHRAIYQHFTNRPSDESLVRVGSLELRPDGSAVITLDAIPLSGDSRLICLPSDEAAYQQPRHKQAMPAGAADAANRVK